MSWFRKSAVQELEPTDTLVHESHLKATELHLLEVDREYRTAEAEFVAAHRELFDYAKRHPDSRSVLLNRNLFARVGAMTADPLRAQLEAAQARALARRNTLLSERAQLMQELGRIH